MYCTVLVVDSSWPGHNQVIFFQGSTKQYQSLSCIECLKDNRKFFLGLPLWRKGYFGPLRENALNPSL